MGFRNQSNTRNNASEQSNEGWKAQGFINVYVNVVNGNKRKLIGIPLKEQKAFERMLLERLQQEGGVEALQANLSITFELADKEVKAADLGW